VNPFVIDSPAPPEDLIDRERELATLADLAEDGHNSRLVAPRRYGKTTLLRRLAEEAERRGMRSVYVDCFGVLTLDDVAGRFDRSYSEALKGPLASWYAGVRRRWRLKGRVGTRGTGIEAEALAPGAADELLAEVLELPRRLHERDGMRTLVMMDEFQELLTAADSADALLRSRIQHHSAQASYVFAGSHPGLMAELFGDRERPLYGQSREIALAPLDGGELAGYIEARFAAGGRSAGAVMGDLLDLVRGHPQRAMLLAHHLWETAGDEEPGPETWERAVAAAFGELQETFERYWERLSANERRTLAAVAWTGRWGEGSSLLAKDTLARFGLSKSTARTLGAQLARAGDLARLEGGGYELVDPLLEAWIASDRHARA
jgi:uncharacterized protein